MNSGTYVSGSPVVGTRTGSWNPATGYLERWGGTVFPQIFPNFLGVFHVTGTVTGTIHAVPEPGSLLLIASGLAGMGFCVRKRK